MNTGTRAAASVLGAYISSDASADAGQSGSTVTGASIPKIEGAVPVALRINGKDHQLRIDPRTTLLDCLRETVALTGTKKKAVIMDSAARAPCT